MVLALEQLQDSLGDRYQLEDELGSGGQGAVFRAHDRRLRRTVAVKFLRPDVAPLLGSDRFKREIAIAASLSHPNIVPLLDSGGEGEHLYYTMPLVEGESLRQRLRRQPQLPLPEALRIVRDVASALDYAHVHGYLHRDIKPENIFLSGDCAIVLDFGIARAIEVAGEESVTSGNLVIGTPMYMSPEQGAGQRQLDGGTDIYSLGCVLYEMLAGSPPFTGATPQAVVARHLMDRPPSLSVVRRSVSPAMEEAIGKSLAKVSADRYATGGEMVQALERARRHPGGGSRIRRSAAAVIGSALVIAGVAVLRPGSEPPASPGVAVAIAPFDRIGEPLANGGSSAHLLFAEAVEWVPGLNALDGTTVLRTGGTSPASLFEMLQNAQELGAKYLVTGVVSAHLKGFRLTVDLYSVDGGVRLVRGADTAMGEQFENALGRLAVQSARAIAEREQLDLGARRAMFSATSSAAALGELIQGQDAFSAGDYERAAAAYARAIEADSTCGLAYLRFSVVQSWHHEHSAALATLEAGLRVRHRMSPRWARLLEARRHYALGEADMAITAFQDAVLEDDLDVDAWLGLGESLFHLGTYSGHSPLAAWGALERVTELDSAFYPIHDHLVDLALLLGDSARATRYLRRMRVDDPGRLAGEQAILIRFGDDSARSAALRRLRELDRQTLSRLVVLWSLGARDLPLVETFASLLTESGRTPDDRRRGAQYKLVALAGQGRWEAGLTAWRQVEGAHQFDDWLISADLAGYQSGKIADSMYAWARDQVNRGAAPDFTLPPWDERQQGFQGLVHRATLEGDSAEVLRLLSRVSKVDPPSDRSDPSLGSLRSSLEARLALLAGDSASAITLLRGSLKRINHRFTWYYPLTSMAPQRRLLSDLLQRRGSVAEAKRWRESFRNSWSIGDVLFAIQPPQKGHSITMDFK